MRAISRYSEYNSVEERSGVGVGVGRREEAAGADGMEDGSDLHKYIEFIEMSLGIATRRILAAYQAPRRFQPPPDPLPPLPRRRHRARELAFIKIAPLIYSGTHPRSHDVESPMRLATLCRFTQSPLITYINIYRFLIWRLVWRFLYFHHFSRGHFFFEYKSFIVHIFSLRWINKEIKRVITFWKNILFGML